MRVMLRRLLMTLLIACLALPAAAMPPASAHGGAAAAIGHDSRHGDDAGQRGDPGAPAAHHDCIGCLTPQVGTPGIAGRDWLAAMIARPAAAYRLDDAGSDPEIPPPRS